MSSSGRDYGLGHHVYSHAEPRADHMSAYATASAVTRHVRHEIPDCDCTDAVIFLALGLRAYIERNPDEVPRSGLLRSVKASMRPVVRGVGDSA